jgi:hypothetical protein
MVMATGYEGSTLVAELNRLANGGTYPARTAFLEEAGAANKWLSLNWHTTIHAATTTTTTGTYAPGTTGADGGTGVGATITAASNGAGYVVDGHAMAVGERIAYLYNTDAKTNGIYTVTSTGSVSSKWVVTRSTDYDNGSRAAEISIGDWFTIDTGTVNAGKTFRMNALGSGVNKSIVVGTDNITFAEITTPTFLYGYETVHALNLKADPLRQPADFKGLNAICNELAGTTGKSAVAALRSIDI